MLVILRLVVIPPPTPQAGDLLVSAVRTEEAPCRGDSESNKFWTEIQAV
jgi:hypothetical protein